MKIVLVAQNSSYTHTNAAVRIFYSQLAPRHDVKIVETTVNDRGGTISLAEQLYELKADMYLFSVYIWNRQNQLQAANAVKQLLPESVVVMGGPEISFETESFLAQNPFIDYLVRGEGEKVICDIADGKITEKGIIDGGVYENFETLPEPYFCAENPYACSDGKLVYYESSRGCPYNCSYCLSSVKKKGERVRFKPTDMVMKEISVLMSKNIKTIKFVDRSFNADVKRAAEIFEGILDVSKNFIKDGKYVGTTCHFEICAALIDQKTIEILSRAPDGLFRFEIGVQTITPSALSAIGRADNTQKILENVDLLREKTKVVIHLDLICGLPTDTYEGIKNSFNAIYGKCDLLQLGILKLLPGTKMRADTEKYSIKYLDTPPYTVLETATTSFCELRRLERIAHETERFCAQNGNFRKTTEFLVKCASTPFDFYEKIALYFGKKENMTVKAVYGEILEFAMSSGLCTAQKTNLLREYLRFDFLLTNQGSVPLCIDKKYTEEQSEFLKTAKNEYIHSFPKNGSPFFVPATEAHIFDFDNENVYIIDRKNGTCKMKMRG